MAKIIKILLKGKHTQFLRNIVKYFLRRAKLGMVSFNSDDRISIFEYIQSCRNIVEIAITDVEAFIICKCLINAEKIDGAIAEIGVYRGGTSYLMANYKKDKELHLFDTFEGIPEEAITAHDTQVIKAGMYPSNLDKVKRLFKKTDKVKFHPGFFPKSADTAMVDKFSFVHLDVDTYTSTMDALKYFYNRLSKGGIIISHDYSSLEGVNKAFNEFFGNRTETIIELPTSQALIVKT